ncbi:SDR family NAD(P)-dependent oxidoreductase [Paenalcaligenes sp. Me131]|uniref:SDR family NAD(P)-dependent oxidoreductase n=1 Tax=Paenalcaligenes sp. Me131 TaxID=3392636 RepID=UPI003D28F0DC
MSTQRVVIITGTSKGLGAAMAQQVLDANTTLFAIARSDNPSLAALAHQQGATLHALQADLSSAEGVQTTQEWLQHALPRTAQHYWLINNAGTVEPVAQANQLNDALAIQHALQLNVGSAIALCATLLAATDASAAERRILNISSGAGRRSVAGWGVYGATKAALDFYTQTLAMENHPRLRCASLAPGVIDSHMQSVIRQQKVSDFPDLQRFLNLHAEQQLSSPEETAAHILRHMGSDVFGSTLLDDIRRYL